MKDMKKDYVEVVINTCYGGYGVSEQAITWLEKHGSSVVSSWELGSDSLENRTNPLLVECVKELGDAASASLAELKVIKIPKDEITRELCIKEYDGIEWVQEVTKEWDGDTGNE